MKQRVLVALLACMGATTAWANDSGVYVGVGAGQYNVELEDDVANFDSDDTVFKVFGGYRINPYFALELDYIDLGAPDQTIGNQKVEASSTGIAPYAIGTLPLGPLEVFARIGYYFYESEIKANGVKVLDDSSEDLVYGVGAGITLFGHLHARLEYEFFDIEDTESANALWLSAAFRF